MDYYNQYDIQPEQPKYENNAKNKVVLSRKQERAEERIVFFGKFKLPLMARNKIEGGG